MRGITRRALLPLLGVAPFRAAAPGSIPRSPVRTRILFGGDIMLSRYVGRLARQRSDPAFPLRDLSPILSSADLSFANLESPFSDHGDPVGQGMVFKAEPEMVAALQVAGIDIVSTANNHARDR